MKEIVWTRNAEDGSYEASLDGEPVGSVYHGGVSGYAWSWYSKGKSGDSTTLGSAKQNIEHLNGIEPKAIDKEAQWERDRERAAKHHAKMLADSNRRNQIADVMALRRAAGVVEKERPNTAVFLRAKANEIEEEYGR